MSQKFKIVLTNSYTGHHSVIENVGGVPFIRFCSTDIAACERWVEEHEIVEAEELTDEEEIEATIINLPARLI